MTLYMGHDIATAEPVRILSDEDYLWFITERLGRDAGDYLNLIIEERNDAIRILSDGISNEDYEEGYDDGHEAGYNDGYDNGFNAGVQTVMVHLKRILKEYES